MADLGTLLDLAFVRTDRPVIEAGIAALAAGGDFANGGEARQLR